MSDPRNPEEPFEAPTETPPLDNPDEEERDETEQADRLLHDDDLPEPPIEP